MLYKHEFKRWWCTLQIVKCMFFFNAALAFVPISISNVNNGFINTPKSSICATSSPLTLSPVPPAPVDNVVILPDAESVGQTVFSIVEEAAKRAISERGYFALAIPGGSILKMLACGNIGEDAHAWTSKTTIAYVNHKCVDMADEVQATHAKARKLFLDTWSGANTIILDGSDDAGVEAQSYENKLKALPEVVLPRCTNTGIPVFDLALIGVGDDGHIGSLYPGREEVLSDASGPWVIPVTMKSPPGITLSLPIMANAREVIVAACGVSDKYPKGKSEGMRRAISGEGETIQTFPAVGLRSSATYILDVAAGSELGYF